MVFQIKWAKPSSSVCQINDVFTQCLGRLLDHHISWIEGLSLGLGPKKLDWDILSNSNQHKTPPATELGDFGVLR